MKLNSQYIFPQPSSDYEIRLNNLLSGYLNDISNQINALTEGNIYSVHNAVSSIPVSGNHYTGDFIRNKNPVELGAANSKYVVTGYLCILSGTPGTWVETRAATGN